MPDRGTLGVRVFTSRAQLPVEDATVAITQRTQSGKYNVLSLQVTDSSGNIKPISIDTPGPLESTEPFGGTPPFARCDIWVEHPDYEAVVTEDVQVFPGTESLQLVELVPQVAGDPRQYELNVREIPAQEL